MGDATSEGWDTRSSSGSREQRAITRRAFIGSAGVAVGAISGGTMLTDLLAAAVRSGVANAAVPTGQPQLVMSVERESDLLLLRFSFYDFRINIKSHPRAIVPTSASNVIIVEFPPQSIAEAVYASDNAGTELPSDPAPVLSALSGVSRLSFTLPKSGKIPLPTMSERDLLSWDGWALNVSAGAQKGATGPIAAPVEPTALETLIEAPYGLYLSPVTNAATTGGFHTGFTNSVDPLSVNNVTSCWSTTLTSRKRSNSAPSIAQVAAVWSSDYDGGDSTPQNQIDYS